MSLPFDTLSGLAVYAGTTFRNPAALGYKRNGTWRGISSRVFLDSVRRAGECLIRMGVRPGDTVGIAAPSSPFWLMADFAALGAGAITVPLFPNAAPDVLRHQIRDSRMRFLFVGSGELRDALLPLCPPEVERIFVLSPRIVQSGGAPSMRDGVDHPDRHEVAPPGEWDARAAAVRASDTATLIYTSGSTGNPKGVELTHGNIVSQVQRAARRFELYGATDSALSFLPLAHIFERMVACYYLASGVSMHFAEDTTTVGDNLRELHPTVMTVVPRFLEKAHDRVAGSIRERRGPLGALGRAALRRAYERHEETPADWKDRVLDRLVYSRIRAKMGGRLRIVMSGSAPLDPRLARFFINLGMPVYEGYGLTETSPVLAVNYPGHRRLGTVGPAFPDVELRIAPDGEVLARGRIAMKGYYGLPEETRAVVDAEGWLHTGDLGSLDVNGYLTITGRKKELFKTAGGKYVAPIPIERALATHKLVDAAVVVAEGRPYATVLLYPDFDALLALREELQHADGEGESQGAFLRSEVVRTRFAAIVDSVNESLSAWERIHRFALADAPPSFESGEMTPTMKIRRHAVEARYKGKIEGMYGGQ